MSESVFVCVCMRVCERNRERERLFLKMKWMINSSDAIQQLREEGRDKFMKWSERIEGIDLILEIGQS